MFTNNLKRLIALSILCALIFTLAGCPGGQAKTDSQDEQINEGIQSYLEKSGDYILLGRSDGLQGEDGDALLAAYVAAADKRQPLPEDLIASYKEIFKSYFGGEEPADEHIKSLIYTEMVVYLAHETLTLPAVTETDRTAAAKELAESRGTDEKLFYTAGGDAYFIDTYIKSQLLIKYLTEKSPVTSAESDESADAAENPPASKTVESEESAEAEDSSKE